MDFVLVDDPRDTSYPIKAVDYALDLGADDELIFSEEEARELIEQLQKCLDKLKKKYVQITFALGPNSSGMTYTYEDPTGELRVGDLVHAPTQYDNRPTLGKVVSLTRGSWEGRTKRIMAKLVPEEL